MKNSMKNPHMFQSVLIALCLLVSVPSFSKELELKSTPIHTRTLVPTITSFSPVDGYAGTTVTITGTNFTSGSIVKIGTTTLSSAAIQFVSSTELQVIIPCGISSGVIDVDGVVSVDTFNYKPALISSVLPNVSYCVGSTVPAVNVVGTPSGVVFSWTNSNAAIGLATSGTGTISTFTAINTTNQPISSTIQVTPSINGCSGITKEYVITINPKPILNTISSQQVCKGTTISTIDLTASSPLNGSGTSYTWSATNADLIGLSTPSGTISPIPSFLTTNASNSTIISQFTITPSYEGCVGDSKNFTISVEPSSVAGTISGPSAVCYGVAPGTLTLNGNVGSVVKWQSSLDNSVWTDINSTSLTLTPGILTTPTYYRAIVKSGRCSEVTTAPYLIAINALPTVNAGIDQTVCSGNSVTLSGSGATSYSWNNGVVNGTSFVPSSTGTYTVTGIGTNGCSNSDQVLVTVNALPTAPSAITQTFLASQNKTVGDLLITSSGTSIWYNSFSGGSLYASSAPLTTGTYYAAQKVNSCESVSRTAVSVSVFADSVGGSISGTTTVCSGVNSTTLTAAGYTGTILKWQSSTVSDFSTNVTDFNVQNATFTAINVTTSLYYRAVVQSGGSTSFSSPAFIAVSTPSNGGTLTAINSSVCKNVIGGALNLTGKLGDVVQWQQSTNSGATWSDIASTATTFTAPALAQTTQYRVEVKNGVCSSSFSNAVTIQVKDTPVVTDFPNQEICIGSTRTFGDAFVAGQTYSLTSNLGYSSTTNLSSVLFNSVGTQVFTYTVTNTASGCSTQDQFEVTTNPLPAATVISNRTICEGDVVNLGASAVTGNTYSWSSNPSGFTSTVANPSVTPTANTTYTLAETNSVTGCSKTNSVQITVQPLPIISITGAPQISICETATNQTIIASIANLYASYNWEVIPANGGSLANTSSLNPMFTPSSIGIANGFVIIRLNVTGQNPCNTIVSKDLKITIDKTTVNLGADQIVCEGPINISSNIQNAGTISWSHNGRGSIVNSTITTATPIYIPSTLDRDQNVTFTVTVTPSNGCGPNVTDSVIYKINGAPTVSSGSSVTICETQQSYVLNGSSTFTDSVVWSHTGSGTLDNPNALAPTYTFSPTDIATGSVTFTLRGKKLNCTDAVSMMTVTIRKNPVANAGTAQTICQGQTVYLTGLAPNNGSVSWSKSSGSGVFNNTTTLTPNYVSSVSDTGTITFTLTAQPQSPCAVPSVATTTVTIIPKPTASISAINPQICEGSTYTVNSASATNYESLEWTASNTGGSFTGGNTLSPTYTPGANDINNGSVKLTLTAKRNSPCTLDAIAEVTLIINKIPRITVVNSTQDICSDAGVAVPISGTGAYSGIAASNYDSLVWTTSGSGTFTTPSPLNTSSANSYIPSAADISSGSVTLTLTASRTPSNCNSSTTNTITLNFIKKPVSNAGPDATICENATYISTTATAANYANVVWSSNGSAGTIANPTSLNGMVYTPSSVDLASGSVTLTLTVNGNSCQAPVTNDVIISFQKLPVITTVSSASICKSANQYAISGTTMTNSFLAGSIRWTSSGTGSFTTTSDPKNPIYIPSNIDKTNGSVTLTMYVMPVSPCATEQSKSFVLSFITEPVASAGPSLTQCDLPFTITTATATMNTISSLRWTASGTGTFNVDNTINPTYTPSALDVQNSPITLTLTASPITPCAVPLVTTTVVNLVKSPVVNIVSPQPTICQDATNVLVSGTTVANALSFVWTSTTGTTISNATSLTPLVTPSATDISNGYIDVTITATPNAPCSTNVVKTVRIPVQRQPIVNAGASQTICQGSILTTSDAITTNVTNINWSNNGGDGQFTTSRTTRVVEYTPGPNEIASGRVLLTLTADAIAPCVGTVTSTIEHLIIKNPVITVNPTQVTICETATYQVPLSQIDVINPTSVASVQWTTTAPSSLSGVSTFTPVYRPSGADIAAGYAILTLTVTPINPCATPIVKTIRVNITKKATIDTTQANYTFCENTPKQLNAVFANHDSATISWRIVSGSGTLSGINTATPIYTPDVSSTTVIIEASVASNSPCTEITTSQFTLNVMKKPLVTFGKLVDTICNTQTSYSLNGNSVANTTASTTYLWTTTGTGTFADNTALVTTYNFSAADLALNTPVKLRLLAQSDALCALTDYKEITITIKPAPTVSTAPTATLCQGDVFTATAIATNQTSVLWTTVGTSNGTFTNANTNNALYTPGTNDTVNFTLRFTAVGDPVCSSATTTKTVTIQLKPVLDAGTESRHNCSGEAFAITGVTGQNLGTITWSSSSSSGINRGTFSNPSILNPSYTPSAAEVAAGTPITLTVSATAIAPCSSPVSDFIILNLDPKQVVNAGVDQTICEGSTVSITGTSTHASSVFWTSSSTGTFTNPSSAATTYQPSAADILNGSVTLTFHGISDSNCPEVIDTMVVSILKKPTASAGSAVSICEGVPYTVVNGEALATNYSAITWSATGPGTLDSSTIHSLNPTYNPTPGQTGDVTLTLTATGYSQCGINAVASKTISIIPKPVVTSPSSRTICQGQTLTLTATEVTASDYSALTWTSSNGMGSFAPNSTPATIYTPTPTQSGNVTLRLTATALNSVCANAFSDVVVTIIPSPIVNAGLDASICQSSTHTISGASVPSGTSFDWVISGPATIRSGTETTLTPVIVPNPGASGTVTLTLTVQGGSQCPTPVSDTVTITIFPMPSVDAGLNQTVCEGVAFVGLSGTASNGTNYTWSTDGAGSIQTTTNPLQAKYIPNPADYSNLSGVNTVTLFLTAAGTNGCSQVVDSMTLTLYSKPQVFAGLDQTACQSSTVSLSGATATNYSTVTWTTSGNGTFNYTSSNGGIRPTYTLGSNDLSTVTLTMSAMPNANCSQVAVTDQMVITVNKNSTIQASSTEVTMCGETFTLPDLITVNNSASISWSDTTGLSALGTITNGTTETPTFTPTTAEIANEFVNLTVTAQPLSGCSTTASQVIKVNLKPKVNANAGTDIVVCQGNSIIVNNGASTTATSYYWTENGTGTIKASTINTLFPEYLPGTNEIGVITLTLHATNPSPCLGEVVDTMTVTISPQPTVNAGADATICETSSYSLVNATAANYDNLSSNLVWVAYRDANGVNSATGTFSNNHSVNPTYTPSPADIALGKVYLTLKVASTSCGSLVADTMELTIAPGTGVNAGVNASICEGSSFVLSQATADNVATLSWISAQNSTGTSSVSYQAGSFSNATSLNPTYIPSSDDVNLGYVYLKLTGASNSTCPSNTSVIRLDIVKKPTVSASDIQMCINTPQITLSGTASNYQSVNWSVQSGPGSIIANSSSPLTPVYVSGLSTTETTSKTAVVRLYVNPKLGCPSTTAVYEDITVNIQALPVVEAGVSGTTCYIAGQPIDAFSIIGTTVANGGTQNWTTSGSGTFTLGNPVLYNSFSNNCTSEVLTLTVNGVGACSTSTNSDSVTLTVNCSIPNLGPVTSSAGNSICQSSSSTITYTVPVNSSVVSYNWSVPSGATIVSGQNTNTITVRYGIGSVSGNVSVFGSNGCGNGSISTFAVTVNALPTATTISGQQLVCEGTIGVVYTALALPGATSYSWTLPNGSTVLTGTNTITVNYQSNDTSGNLSVIANNACGAGPVSSNYPITMVAKPSLSSALTPAAICSDSMFTYVPTSATTGTSFAWTRAIQSGITNPVASGNGNINETLVNTTSNPINVIYQYAITGPNPTACSNVATVTVSVKPIPSLTSSANPVAICSGTTFNYTPTTTTSGVINWTRASVVGISESASSGTSSISEVLTNTTSSSKTVIYKIILPTNSSGCSKTIDLSVVVNPLPTASISGTVSVCKNDTNPLVVLTGANGTAPYTFTYTINGGVNQTIVSSIGNTASLTTSTAASGTKVYNLISVQDSSTTTCSQLQTGTATVIVNSIPVLVVNQPAAVCEPNTVDITATTTGSDSGLIYTYWKDALATLPYTTPTTSGSGTYYIKATNTFGCYDIKSVTVVVNPLPSATISGTTTICSNSASPLITFTGSVGTAPYTFRYAVNGGTPQIITTSSGNSVTLQASTVTAGVFNYNLLSVQDSSSSACMQNQTGSAVITVNPSPQATISGTRSVCTSSANPTITFSGSNGTAPYTFTYTINGGANQTITSVGSIATITVPTNTVGIYTYNLVSVSDSSTTTCSQMQTGSAVVTVNPLPTLIVTNPAEVCVPNIVNITNTTSGSSVGLTYGYWNDNATTIGIVDPSAIATSGTYFIKGTDANGCSNIKPVVVKINPLPSATISGLTNYTVCQNDTQPIITFTGSNATPPYVFQYRINSGAFQTVSTTASSSTVSVAIPTTTVGNYTITLLSVRDSSPSTCLNTSITLPSEAYVNVQQGGTIVPQSGMIVSQTLCQDSAMNPAVFTIGGSASSAYVTNLPTGVNGVFNSTSHTLTISGSPTATGVFNYVIHTAGSVNGCDSTLGGTLTINANDTITVLTPTTVNQKVCACSAIKPITYSLGGGATGGDVTFSPHAPTGLIWSIASNVLTISGTSCDVGNFTYTIQSYGICDQTTYSGNIEINQNATVSLVSGNPNPTLCVGTTLSTPIKYAISPSSEVLRLTGTLPTGLSFNSATGIISGTPTQSGSFPYTITSSTSCGNSIVGVIKVNPVQSISLLSGNTNQTACINNAIDPVVFTIASGITSVTVNPVLPNGVTASVDTTNGIVTISGTPTVATSLPQNYVITTQGGCSASASTSISLDIKPAATITFLSATTTLNQAVCLNGPIVPIRFSVGGGATGIIAPILPTGVTISRDVLTGVYTIQGNPTVNGTFTIPITTSGCSKTENITISNVNSAVSIDLTSATGTDLQTLCQTNFNSPINPIKYTIVGVTGATVAGLPAGVTATFTPATGELVISGTPTQAGVFNYTITSLPCSVVKTGVLKVSIPMFITNEIVTNVSCSTSSNGGISVTIIGGVSSNGSYAVHWAGPNGFQQNLTSITGLVAGDYTLTGTDAVGCPLPTKTYTVLPAQPINIALVSTTNVSCNGALGCANFNYSGGSGIYTRFVLQYLDPSSQVLNTVVPPNNNYYNICNLKAGLYYLSVTDSNNCTTEPYLFTIQDFSTLHIDSVRLDENLCSNTSGKVRITVSSLDSNLTFYYNNVIVPHLSLGNNTYELSISNPTTPTGIIKVMNSQNCWDTATINTNIVNPQLNYTSHNLTTYGAVSVNESVQFTNGLSASNIPAEYDHIVWDFGDNSPYKVFYNPKDINPNSSGESITTVFHTYAIDGLYPVTLTVYNKFGCSRSITEILTVGQGAGIMLPTAFSPNNDGINDLFRPSLLGLKEVSMYIYDNWGNLIYEVSSDTASLPADWGWNGIEKVNSEPKNGNYRYYIMAKTINDKVIEKEGQFMLIK
jgi:gliding motility-associated-like protein